MSKDFLCGSDVGRLRPLRLRGICRQRVLEGYPELPTGFRRIRTPGASEAGRTLRRDVGLGELDYYRFPY